MTGQIIIGMNCQSVIEMILRAGMVRNEWQITSVQIPISKLHFKLEIANDKREMRYGK